MINSTPMKLVYKMIIFAEQTHYIPPNTNSSRQHFALPRSLRPRCGLRVGWAAGQAVQHASRHRPAHTSVVADRRRCSATRNLVKAAFEARPVLDHGWLPLCGTSSAQRRCSSRSTRRSVDDCDAPTLSSRQMPPAENETKLAPDLWTPNTRSVVD